jgi:hypothetical protein
MNRNKCVALIALAVIAAYAMQHDAAAQSELDDARHSVVQDCWRRPAPATVEETLHVIANNGAGRASNTGAHARPDFLSLSTGDIHAA